MSKQEFMLYSLSTLTFMDPFHRRLFKTKKVLTSIFNIEKGILVETEDGTVKGKFYGKGEGSDGKDTDGIPDCVDDGSDDVTTVGEAKVF